MTRALALAALLVGGCRDAAPAHDPVAAPPPTPGADIRHMAAWLDVDTDALRIGARAALTVAHPARLDTLALGLDGALDVRTVRVDGLGVDARRDGDALLIPLPDFSSLPAYECPPGSCFPNADTLSVVEIAYEGTPRAGLYAGEWSGRRVVYTDGWPDRTAGWLPAAHHPSDPVRATLTVGVPETDADGRPQRLVVTGDVRADSLGGGRRWVRTRVGPAPGATASGVADGVPVYTLAFAAGPFEIIQGGTSAGGVAVRHALLDARLAPRLARTAAALDTLAALFGPYPFAAYTTVQVPMTYAGMENAAAPFLRAALYTADAPGRNAVEEVNFHELVHQWWGNAVAPADWRDLWLAEGITTYLVADLYARLDGADAGRRHLVRLTREISPHDADRALRPSALADPADALSPTVYQKGAAVVHLIRLTVGEAAFWRAMRGLQASHAARPLSTDGFRAALETASGRDLGPLFARWVDGATRPRLLTRWDRTSRTLSWSVEDDAGTLDGVPFGLYVRQGDVVRWLAATDGVARLAGDARPTVEPVGLLLDVR